MLAEHQSPTQSPRTISAGCIDLERKLASANVLCVHDQLAHALMHGDPKRRGLTQALAQCPLTLKGLYVRKCGAVEVQHRSIKAMRLHLHPFHHQGHSTELVRAAALRRRSR